MEHAETPIEVKHVSKVESSQNQNKLTSQTCAAGEFIERLMLKPHY
jgi:hypothetical protein